MRLETIKSKRETQKSNLEILPSTTTDVYTSEKFSLRRSTSLKRKLSDVVAPYFVRMNQASNLHKLGCELPDAIQSVVIGERFALGDAWQFLKQRIAPSKIDSVLVEGCGVGDELVQNWLRLGVKNVFGLEYLNLKHVWEQTVPMLQSSFNCKVEFRQGSVDAIPYEDEMFNVVSSAAVYEHVANLDAAASECNRVLQPGGIAFHSIGPMYYGFAGDHCISCYGLEAGFDHLLLDDECYEKKISDREFFSYQLDPNCNFWALNDKFSFAKTQDYFNSFEPYFEIAKCVAVICPFALQYRDSFPEKWHLLCSHLNEIDLLLKSIHIILHKK